MKINYESNIRFGATLITAILLSACGVDQHFFSPLVESSMVRGGDAIDGGGGTPNSGSSANDPGSTVCNPFDNNGNSGAGNGTTAQNGLLAGLYYVSNGAQTQYSTVWDYQTHGTLADASLFFSQINVPTRPFDAGFSTQAGTVLSNANGDPLYEWFSLHFESNIRLAAGDVAGKYQFAVLSDDGAVFQLNLGNGFQTFINNDGTHATQLGCSTTAVNLQAGQNIPIKFDYYQGPRLHIALMLLWREYPTNNTPFPINDAACGQSGNSLFFNSTTTPSTPQATYTGMLARGWRPVPAKNFFLNDGSTGTGGGISNPCNH